MVQPVLVRLSLLRPCHVPRFINVAMPFSSNLQVKQLEGDILTAITFLPRSLLTATKVGLVKFWVRPLAVRSRRMKNGHAQRGMSISMDATDLG